MQTNKLLLSLLASASLTGCAAGPDYVAPVPPVVSSGPFLGADATPGVSQSEPADDWWRLYGDPTLDQLVADALAANTDIRVAVARIERARASLRGAQSSRLPSTDIGASASYGRVPDSQVTPGADRERRTIDGGIEIGYELDLFGRVARSVEASRGDYEATQEDAAAVRVAVVADTVRAYVDAAASAERIAVAQKTVDLLDSSVRITGAREQHGLADRLDVIRVSQLRDQQAASIPSFMADRDAALFRLATLTGRTPGQLPEAASERPTIPELSKPIPVGDGRTLLARRPDVRAAERRLAADTARIGVATADLYPRIMLGGSAGTTAIGATDLLGGGPLRWLLGSLISWSFPNQEAIRARIGEARADAKADLATFDGTVLRALEETETALSAYRNAMLRQTRLESARDAAERAANVSLARQRAGRIDFLAVLDAQRTLANAEADLATGRRAVVFAQVDLFRALGGGWQDTEL
ncbi:transporter [Croceicoccus estronivorus]|uniref:efflux transporter outer membrane subunit n=1 Tax=Croceicoccus estronivorus TaxID=1172626 RepID=UPI000833648E|nr:TolC family protein [Croceicoccus estronivorus]OCC23408.1 transporter [Croceicoccus estronivorus]